MLLDRGSKTCDLFVGGIHVDFKGNIFYEIICSKLIFNLFYLSEELKSRRFEVRSSLL